MPGLMAPNTVSSPATDLAQALSNLQSASGTMVIAERVIMGIASALVILEAFRGLLCFIKSHLDQVPATVDTLLKIKSSFERYSGLKKEYLQRYEEIHQVVVGAMAEVSGSNKFALWRKLAKANLAASRLLRDISLRLTALDDATAEFRSSNHNYKIQNTIISTDNVLNLQLQRTAPSKGYIRITRRALFMMFLYGLYLAGNQPQHACAFGDMFGENQSFSEHQGPGGRTSTGGPGEPLGDSNV